MLRTIEAVTASAPVTAYCVLGPTTWARHVSGGRRQAIRTWHARILIAAINAVMDLVDLGVLAAAEPASALHQIVRLGLYPRPEAVAVKWLLRPDMVVDEIAPGGDWFVWQDIEGAFPWFV